MNKTVNRSTNNVKKARRNRRPRKPVKSSIRGLELPLNPVYQGNVVCKTDGLIQASAASFCVYESRLMSLGSLGFSGGSAAAPSVSIVGLADSTAYALARSERFELELNGVSEEGANVNSINVIFADTQPSTVITTYALAQSASVGYIHSPVMKLGVVSGYANFSMPNMRITAQQVVRDREVRGDRDFICTINPAPANANQEVWVAIIVTAMSSATNLTLGVNVSASLRVYYSAFSRRPGV